MTNTRKDGLLRHSLILMAGTQIGNVANLLFQIAMMRGLSPVEYGVLAAMLSVILIVGTPLTALTTAAAHITARYFQQSHPEQIHPLVSRWLRFLLVAGIIILIITVAGSGLFCKLFKIDSIGLPIAAGTIMALALFPPLYNGVLQGAQAFIWLSISGQIWGVARLFFGVLFVYLISAEAMSALVGHGIGIVISMVVGWIGLKSIMRPYHPNTATPEASPGEMIYLTKSLVVLSAFAVLMNADISIVKHYFSPHDAGVYARASTIARSVIFLPMPIAAAMFPKVVSMGEFSWHSRKTLIQAIIYVAVVIAFSAILCILLYPFIWYVFTGGWPAPATTRIAREVILAMGPLGLTYLLMNFEIAQNRFRIAYLLLPLAVCYIGGVGLWHATLGQIILVLGCISTASALILLFGLPRSKA